MVSPLAELWRHRLVALHEDDACSYGPLNIYTANLEALGASLKHIDFDKTESFGVNSLNAFTWKDSARFGCLHRMRALHRRLSGQRSRQRTLAARHHSSTTGLDARPIPRFANQNNRVGPATSSNALWQCTTCAACMEACPVFIEQMPKIVDMRRYLVMEEAEFPDSMQQAIMSLEKRGHPFSGTNATRLDWAEGLGVNQISETKDAEVLLWVGCGGALVERNQKVTRATAQLLTQAGVKFAIMGREEKCSGDPARRIGNEFLFETLAKENVENLNRYEVKKVITACPHCFNTFKNEYPQYGGMFEVYHHSEYLARLVDEGKLKPLVAVDREGYVSRPVLLRPAERCLRRTPAAGANLDLR